jgi:hypothetical protein
MHSIADHTPSHFTQCVVLARIPGDEEAETPSYYVRNDVLRHLSKIQTPGAPKSPLTKPKSPGGIHLSPRHGPVGLKGLQGSPNPKPLSLDGAVEPVPELKSEESALPETAAPASAAGAAGAAATAAPKGNRRSQERGGRTQGRARKSKAQGEEETAPASAAPAAASAPAAALAPAPAPAATATAPAPEAPKQEKEKAAPAKPSSWAGLFNANLAAANANANANANVGAAAGAPAGADSSANRRAPRKAGSRKRRDAPHGSEESPAAPQQGGSEAEAKTVPAPAHAHAHAQQADEPSIFVKNIPLNTSREDLVRVFAKFGATTKVFGPAEKAWAFITFADGAGADAAVAAGTATIGANSVSIERKKDKESLPPRRKAGERQGHRDGGLGFRGGAQSGGSAGGDERPREPRANGKPRPKSGAPSKAN